MMNGLKRMMHRKIDERVPLGSIIGLSVLIAMACFLSYTLLSCTECYDISALSPTELMGDNDVVALAEFQRIDTLQYLGRHHYLQTDCDYYVVEYLFVVVHPLKGVDLHDTLALWNYERSCETSTILDVKSKDRCLVYGGSITPEGDLSRITEPLMPQDLTNKFEVDQMNAETIIKSAALRGLLMDRLAELQVLWGTDQGLSTLWMFARGRLCYYDEDGHATSVNSADYFDALKSISPLR
jgi:hypothetical protein